MEPAGLNTINPLLKADGTSALAAGTPCRRLDRATGAGAGGVLAGEGPHRETRLLHERRPRRYEFAIDPANSLDVEMVRQAIAVTRGGAVSTRWRHWLDDPAGDVDTAPRWRIVNASEAERFVLDRGPGGVVAKFSLVLEQV